MLARFSLSTALLAASVLAVAAPLATGAPPEDKAIFRAYPVMDLIMSPVPFAGSTPCQPALKDEQKPCLPPPVAARTNEDELIRLITTSIAPCSWCDCGGTGTIDFYRFSAVLAINQTPDIQEQVVELLSALRRLNDREIAVEVKLVTVPGKLVKQCGLKIADEAAKKPVVLDDKEVRQFLEKAASHERSSISQSPRLTLQNGRSGTMSIADNLLNQIGGMTYVALPNGSYGLQPLLLTVPVNATNLAVQATASADGRSVRLTSSMTLQHTEENAPVPMMVPVYPNVTDVDPVIFTQYVSQPSVKTFTVSASAIVPNGKTLVLGGFKDVVATKKEDHQPPSRGKFLSRLLKGNASEPEADVTFVLVTPRIIIAQDEEKPATGFVLSPERTLEHVKQLMEESENLRQVQEELARFWMGELKPAAAAPKAEPEKIAPPKDAVECPLDVVGGILGMAIGVASHQPLAGAAIGASDAGRPAARQDAVIQAVLKAYFEACADGNAAEADKFAKMALAVDPTCFSKKR